MHDFLTRGIPNFSFYGVLILLGTKGIGNTEKSNFVSDVEINYLYERSKCLHVYDLEFPFL